MPMNYFSVGKEIAQRLRDGLPALRGVHYMRDLDDDMRGLACPCAIVAHRQDVIAQDLRHGSDSLVKQRWVVLLLNDNTNREAGFEEDGQLIFDTLQLLQGWQPESGHSSLYRISGPADDYVNGRSLYPLQFEIAVRVDASAQ